jgi:hypothetical protein
MPVGRSFVKRGARSRKRILDAVATGFQVSKEDLLKKGYRSTPGRS